MSKKRKRAGNRLHAPSPSAVLWLEISDDGERFHWKFRPGFEAPKFTLAAALLQLQNSVAALFPPEVITRDSHIPWPDRSNRPDSRA